VVTSGLNRHLVTVANIVFKTGWLLDAGKGLELPAAARRGTCHHMTMLLAR